MNPRYKNIPYYDAWKNGDFIFDVLDIPSAVGLARSSAANLFAQKDIETMASILARYSDSNGKGVTILHKALPSEEWQKIYAIPAGKDFLDAIRI